MRRLDQRSANASGHCSRPLDGILTPDRRYIVVRRRLWRATNPALPEAERRAWTRSLMEARRAVARGNRAGDAAAVSRARGQVDRAKRALGERGPVWWSDSAPDYNRRIVDHTPYLEWFERAERLSEVLISLLEQRAGRGSICPSDVARTAMPPRTWRHHMDEVREVGRHLAQRSLIGISQRGRRLDPGEPFTGPIRFSLQGGDA